MPNENLHQRRNVPTLPLEANDPFRFGQLTETAKDCFQREIQNFFDQQRAAYPEVLAEVPTIQKFSFSSEAGSTPTETITRIILQRPDITQELPLIAITSATGQNLSLGLGTQLMDQIKGYARLRGTRQGPYALVDGDKLAVRTWPNGTSADPVVSTVLFKSGFFADIGAALLSEVIAFANVQMLYATADEPLYSEPTEVLRLRAVGVLAPNGYPNRIEILGPPYSTANALSQLGFTAGQTDDAGDHPPRNRYQQAANITVNIDIGTEDENQRRELTDLIWYFFSSEMDKRDNTFYGRSVFDDEFSGPSELFQVTLLGKHSLAGEAELPRSPSTGEQRDYLYVNRISVPITLVDAVDRLIVTPPAYLNRATLSRSRVNDDGLPAGDHSETGETSG